MAQSEMIGIVVIGLAAVFGLISLFLQLIVKPVNELTISVTKLVSALDGVNVSQMELKQEVGRHDSRLDVVEHALVRHNIS